jgi:hypothetical protein
MDIGLTGREVPIASTLTKSGDVLTVVAKNPLKKVYVTAILERIGEN